MVLPLDIFYASQYSSHAHENAPGAKYIVKLSDHSINSSTSRASTVGDDLQHILVASRRTVKGC